jgi:soluble lytic murein transglycosylase-like protein
MLSWLMGAVLCLTLLTGCAGSKANLVKSEPVTQEPITLAPDIPDESLTQELSSKRLEELYAKSGIPGWDPSLEAELKNWEHQVKIDVPIQMNKQVRAYLVYFSTERHGTIRNYLARSTRYLPMIKKVFEEYGLPEDLAYLAMIESGFNNKATSPAAAAGMWQFIRGTGLRYGLNVDSYVDERRDPEKSTRAAAQYLLDLYKQFGSWYLAAASYNCGEGRVQRELDQSKNKNFWELSANQCLPTETKNYVPQMIAATLIAKNPEKFGFKNVPYQAPLKVDTVKVNEPTSLRAVAFAINMQPEDIQILNPALLRGVTPPDSPNYTLNLPPNNKQLFDKNITLARVEYPALACRPVRTARSGGHHYYSRSRRHSYQAESKHAARHAAYAKHTTTHKSASASEARYARKGSHPEAKETTATVHASMFGGVGASKHAARKTQGKTEIAKASVKKSSHPSLAKKSETHARSTHKTRIARKKAAPARKARDKYSKHKSARSAALFARR